VTLDRIWAGWRNDYVSGVANVAPVPGECVFCSVFAAEATDRERLVVHRGDLVVAMLNLYPYGSGHMLILPIRHMAALSDLDADERVEMFDTLTDATTALMTAYGPDGLNVGANLGRAAGAGIPGHLHLHALPRWSGDTNFITTVGNARVINEDLATSYDKIQEAWPR
jgi:ATP adenylyltransferase